MVVASLEPEGIEAFRETRIACSPSAPSVALATLLDPLLGLGATGCRATVLLSAGLAGRDGIEELSAQVTALFNGRTPPRKVFTSGLAFDLVAQAGPLLEDGSSSVERRVIIEVATLLRLDPSGLAVTTCLVPLFAGLALSAFVSFDDPPDAEEVRRALEQADTVHVGDPPPGPRRLAGRQDLYVGRIRSDPAGQGVHLWATADNLRFGASANALGIALLLERQGYL